MWSDRYIYYNIQSDLYFSEKTESEKVVQLLMDTKCFVQKTHQSFTNAEGFPWVDIAIVMTENGNFATSNEPLQYVSLIAIVGSKRNNIDQSVYTNVFLDIAEKLKWKLFLEEDDCGNENVEIVR